MSLSINTRKEFRDIADEFAAMVSRRPEISYNIKEFVKMHGLSLTSFYTTFSKVLGEPPVAFIARKRLELAEWILSNDHSKKLCDAAREAGMKDYRTLNRYFSAFRGTTAYKYVVTLRSKQKSA